MEKLGFRFKFSFNFDKNSLTAINWRPFWAGLAGGLIFSVLMTLISYINLPTMQFVSSSLKIDILETIEPKLRKNLNNFKLQNSNLNPNYSLAFANSKSFAYLVSDFDTGEIIAENKLSQRLPIASLTKIMTAVVALDLVSPQEIFTISKKSAKQIPTKIGVVPGEKMRLEELLYASLLTSANDATQVIKEGIDQKYTLPNQKIFHPKESIFIKAMNLKAKVLNLKNTHFDNPQGFDSPGNYSSVEDLAVLTHYALNYYPLIAQIVQKDYYLLAADNNHKQFDLYNWNGLVGVYPNTLGVKIGNTDDAGTTTIVLSEREGKKIIAVLLGASDVFERDLAAAKLLDLGFAQSASLPPVSLTKDDLKRKYATWKFWN